MDPVAREELTRDLLHSGFLLVMPEMDGRSQATRYFCGPNIQDGKRYEVLISVKVEEAR